jgi:hypothetical protein
MDADDVAASSRGLVEKDAEAERAVRGSSE